MQSIGTRFLDYFTGSTTDPGAGWRFGFYIGENIGFWHRHNGTGDMIILISTNNYTDGQWHHAAVTIDGSGSNAILYADGEPVANDTFSNLKDHAKTYMTIGTHDGIHYNFTGEIDEIRMYERVLSPDEIKVLADNAVILPPGEMAAITHTCNGMCNYRLIMGGISRTAMVIC